VGLSIFKPTDDGRFEIVWHGGRSPAKAGSEAETEKEGKFYTANPHLSVATDPSCLAPTAQPAPATEENKASGAAPGRIAHAAIGDPAGMFRILSRTFRDGLLGGSLQ
jgi:hypothetical protein